MSASAGNGDGRIRVAYIDDQLLFREAVASVLESQGQVTIAYSASHHHDNFSALRNGCAEVVLIGLDMQIRDPIATVREARIALPELPICALVAADRLERAREAILLGCRGAVSTAASVTVLVAALQNLADGQPYVDATLGGRLLAKTISRTTLRQNSGPNGKKFLAEAGDISKN